MKIVLNIQLQQDNGTPIWTGTRTQANFTTSLVPGALGFLSGERMRQVLYIFGGVADGDVPVPVSPDPIQI